MKKVIVTGGNKGIGKAICKLLLEKHPSVHVILASRNLGRGQQALEELQKDLGQKCTSGRLDVLELDISSDKSVESAASSFDDSSLYGIINNAGIGWSDSNLTGKDIVNTNYFGVRRVNDCFATKLQRPGGRIVNLGSASGPMYVQDAKKKMKQQLGEPWTIIKNPSVEKCPQAIAAIDELAKSHWDNVSGYDAYGFSKALLSAYTWWHSRQESELVINGVTPGFINTDLTAGMGATNPPSKGAIPPVELLMNAEFDTIPKGRFYGSDCKRSPLDEYRSPGDDEYTGSDGPF